MRKTSILFHQLLAFQRKKSKGGKKKKKHKTDLSSSAPASHSVGLISEGDNSELSLDAREPHPISELANQVDDSSFFSKTAPLPTNSLLVRLCAYLWDIVFTF